MNGDYAPVGAPTAIETVSDACAEVWNAMRTVGGPFWNELAGLHRALAIECYKAGNLAAINLSRRSLDTADGVEAERLAGEIYHVLHMPQHAAHKSLVSLLETRLASRTPNAETVVKAEPVAWQVHGPGWGRLFHNREAAQKLHDANVKIGSAITPLYASPPSPAEVTDEMVERAMRAFYHDSATLHPTTDDDKDDLRRWTHDMRAALTEALQLGKEGP